MKCNDRELVDISRGLPQMEGRLQHKRAHKSVFKERWFKLRSNLLFYFNITELGQLDDRQPAGIIILENCKINADVISEGAFAFSIVFRDEHEKRHILTARTEGQVNQWVTALRQASYEYWRSRLITLQERLFVRTGTDPLLIYPRNHGIVRDEAWGHTSNFRSHIRAFTSTAPTIPSIVTKETKNLIELL
ncbi:pleckstrin homology domain-containing family J member 1-like [Diachasmimorpha longicaudata]|uniref:pleckstrin homology domain-containing family J member 1-like n=1 Tax=Diachasmimorpha longicaudata TaxID=58733 RepID=UPI0030B91954